MENIFKKQTLWLTSFVISVLCIAWTIPANSAENLRLIPFQGRLTDAEGAALNGVYRITFAIYDAPTGGVSKWTETHQTVSVSNGQLNVLLGSMTNSNLDDPDGNGDTSDAVLFDASSGPRFLGIKVGEDTDQEMIPRQQLVPAFHARTADHALEADNADTLDGHDSSYFLSPSIQEPVNISASSDHLRLKRESSETTGGKICFLDLSQNDSQENEVPAVYPYIRFHDAGNFWQRIEGREDGLHFKDGNIDIDTHCNIYAQNITAHGAIIAPEGTLRDDGGGWIRTYGDTGWFNHTYDGGWHMTDANWIRSYGGKSIYHDAGVMRTDGIFEVGPGGDRFRVDEEGNVGIKGMLSMKQVLSLGTTDTVEEGGEIFWEGAGSYKRWHQDIYQDKMRFWQDGWDTAHTLILGGNGNVGIGCAPHVPYKLYVNGNFGATVKFFDIQDPRYNDEKRRLIHSTLEGPEIAVYYRGEAKLFNRTVTIELPSYFEVLTSKKARTVLLTAKNGWSPLYVDGEVKDGKFMVKTTEQGNSGQEFYWEVKAVRADIEPLEVQVIRPE